jgi:hypothetical protein
MTEQVDKVLNLVNSTNEMIDLCHQKIKTLKLLSRAVIESKLLKDVSYKIVFDSKDLSADIKELLVQNKVDLKLLRFQGLYSNSECKTYDNGIASIRTEIKGVTTYIYVINDKVVFCPV